jgi:excinuclease ABC subunit C
MQGETGEILYVGKANNLRSRLRSYFSAEGDGRAHIRFLMNRVRAIETIVTDTEKEALILENTLIKKHRPRYNIHLRDDKTYVSLRLDPA